MTFVPCDPNDDDGANLSQEDFSILQSNVFAFLRQHVPGVRVNLYRPEGWGNVGGITVTPTCAAVAISARLPGFRFLD